MCVCVCFSSGVAQCLVVQWKELIGWWRKCKKNAPHTSHNADQQYNNTQPRHAHTNKSLSIRRWWCASRCLRIGWWLLWDCRPTGNP